MEELVSDEQDADDESPSIRHWAFYHLGPYIPGMKPDPIARLYLSGSSTDQIICHTATYTTPF